MYPRLLNTLLSLFISLLTGISHAQEVADSAFAGSTLVHLGKVFDSADMDYMSFHYDSLNRRYIGQTYFNFDVTATNGKNFSLASCKGKVTIILFWMVTGGYDHVPAFNDLYNSLKDNPSFLMFSITPEGSDVPAFIKDHKVDFPIVAGSSWQECRMLDYSNGFPCFIVLNKAGIVSLVQKGGLGDKDAFFTTSSSKLTAFLQKLAAQ